MYRIICFEHNNLLNIPKQRPFEGRTAMKILLAAINAKYIHSNLAIYSLKGYSAKYKEQIQLAEYTINNYLEDIISDIYKKKPDFIGLSCYIWNISMVKAVARELHKVLPDTKIWLGGPEVSYDAESELAECNYIDGIMIGEGEATFLQLMEYYIDGIGSLEEISGIAYLQKTNQTVVRTEWRRPLDLNDIPFPYDNIEQFENKIIYYESSRGCPYSCSYCLSSIEKGIRLRDADLVKKELMIFLNHKIPQVKFIDRTFNCNRNHAMEIWQFIKEQDNGITNFHFEISADLLREEELNLIQTFRTGLIQLEIGVQSTNKETIEAINRNMDFENLSKSVKRIHKEKNIHQHLDLIAGLPYENYESFRNSFNDVYMLEPDQLQLGFLKVLKGSKMLEESKKYEIVYKDVAPYEVLFTKWLSYDEVLELKKVEEMVEVYYNSGQFVYTVTYLTHFYDTPFDMYKSLGDYYEEKKLFQISHARMSRYYILLEYFKEKINEDTKVLEEILLFDLYLRENLKNRPDFAPDISTQKTVYHNFYENESNIHQYLSGYENYNKKQISKLTHLEQFSIDIIETARKGNLVKNNNYVLFDYCNRNPYSNEAKITILNEIE
jgi:Fe-S oxidoreductase